MLAVCALLLLASFVVVCIPGVRKGRLLDGTGCVRTLPTAFLVVVLCVVVIIVRDFLAFFFFGFCFRFFDLLTVETEQKPSKRIPLKTERE